MTEIINWGIVAPGRIAHKFANDLKMADGARLHAVASRSLERAREFARKYDAEYAYGSYGEMTSCPDLDVVYIASPHSAHCEHALLFLNHKIPVLCEKPMAMNSKQVRQMVKAARDNDTFLMEAIWTRFIPLFDKVLEMVEAGKVGTLNTVRADFGFKADYNPEGRLFNLSLGGGSLLDVGLYPVYLATQLWGKPGSIKATAIFGETGTDDSCAMLLRYPGYKMAILDCSVVNSTRTVASLYGETGKIVIQRRFHEPENLTVVYDDDREEQLHIPKTGHGYYHEILEVNKCLRQGRKECEKLPLDFSLLLMETLDAIRGEAGIRYPGLNG